MRSAVHIHLQHSKQIVTLLDYSLFILVGRQRHFYLLCKSTREIYEKYDKIKNFVQEKNSCYCYPARRSFYTDISRIFHMIMLRLQLPEAYLEIKFGYCRCRRQRQNIYFVGHKELKVRFFRLDFYSDFFQKYILHNINSLN